MHVIPTWGKGLHLGSSCATRRRATPLPCRVVAYEAAETRLWTVLAEVPPPPPGSPAAAGIAQLWARQKGLAALSPEDLASLAPKITLEMLSELPEFEVLRRLKISAANKGKVPWNKGKKHSPEILAKIKWVLGAMLDWLQVQAVAGWAVAWVLGWGGQHVFKKAP